MANSEGKDMIIESEDELNMDFCGDDFDFTGDRMKEALANQVILESEDSSDPKDIIVNWIERYRPIYENKARDFNVLTTVHLSENDHTNILCEILNMKDGKEKPFMKSFVKEVLGIEYAEDFVAKTQIASIGINDKGYIDLLLESPKICIVIENKVCGAGDMDYQLFRYYYTYVKPERNEQIHEEKKICAQVNDYWSTQPITPKNPKDVYIVYLTETMEKQPNAKSLPEGLKSKLEEDNHYIHITYENDIYSWLKNKVLPSIIEQGKTGNPANSIILYLRELKNILGVDNAQNKWYNQNKGEILTILGCEEAKSRVQQFININKIYKELDKESKKNVYKDNIYLLDLKNCVKYYQANVYENLAPDNWTIRCAESYIDIFPSGWLERFGGTAKSSIHFSVNNWKNNSPRIELNIHDEAYRKYLNANEDQIMASIKEALKSFFKNVNYKKGKDSCDIELDYNSKNFEWNPDNPKDFFENFVKDDQIQTFVALAEKDFQ